MKTVHICTVTVAKRQNAFCTMVVKGLKHDDLLIIIDSLIIIHVDLLIIIDSLIIIACPIIYFWFGFNRKCVKRLHAIAKKTEG